MLNAEFFCLAVLFKLNIQVDSLLGLAALDQDQDVLVGQPGVVSNLFFEDLRIVIRLSLQEGLKNFLDFLNALRGRIFVWLPGFNFARVDRVKSVHQTNRKLGKVLLGCIWNVTHLQQVLLLVSQSQFCVWLSVNRPRDPVQEGNHRVNLHVDVRVRLEANAIGWSVTCAFCEEPQPGLGGDLEHPAGKLLYKVSAPQLLKDNDSSLAALNSADLLPRVESLLKGLWPLQVFVEEGRSDPRDLLVPVARDYKVLLHLPLLDVELPLTILNVRVESSLLVAVGRRRAREAIFYEELLHIIDKVPILVCLNEHFDDGHLNDCQDVLQLVVFFADNRRDLRKPGSHKLCFLVGVVAQLTDVFVVEALEQDTNLLFGLTVVTLDLIGVGVVLLENQRAQESVWHADDHPFERCVL